MLLTENKPYIIKKSQKQGWRVWVNDSQCYTNKISINNKWKYKLTVKTKYRCIKGFFKNAYEAESWYRNRMFLKTLDPSFLS